MSETKEGYDVSLPDYTQTAIAPSVLASQKADYWHQLIGAPEAHERNKGSSAVIYIVDTARSFQHEDLATEGNQFGADFVNEPGADGHGHGHLCGGVAAGLDNQVGVIGAAPEALIVPVRGLNRSGQGTETWITNAVRHARKVHEKHFPHRVGIISMSFGGSREMPKLYAELKACVAAGMIPVAAAGNSGYQSGNNTIAYPARYTDICICVGALGTDSRPANFSSGGPEMDVTAFGVNILTTNNVGGYSSVNGTSFSCPMVAGVVAVFGTEHIDIIQKEKGIAFKLVRSFLREYAKDVHSPGWDTRTGAGLTTLPPYLANAPQIGPPDDDDTGPDPDPAPGTPPEREPRELVIDFTGRTFTLVYATMNGPASAEATVETLDGEVLSQGREWKLFYLARLAIAVQTTLYADEITNRLDKFITEHLPAGRRGYLIAEGDHVDAAYWAGHFIRLFAKREGLTVITTSGTSHLDPEGPGIAFAN